VEGGGERESDCASLSHQHARAQLNSTSCSHQIHPGLRIDLTLSQTSYHALLEVSWQAKAPGSLDVKAALVEALPGVFTDKAAFLATLAARPAAGAPPTADLGPVVASFPFGSDTARTVDIHATMLASASAVVKALHARVQNLLTFFIDGASDIDPADPAWELLTAVVRREAPAPAPTPTRATVVAGMATLNHMWGYPDVTRLRVCQVLALPPAQGQGVGEGLVRAAYALADARQDPVSSSGRPVLDVTYEDPTEEMQVLREKVEAGRAAGCAWLAKAADAAAAQAGKGEAAAAAKGKGEATAGDADQRLPPPVLSLSPSDAARARHELHLTRAATAGAWEALLAARLGTGSPALVAAVRARLAAAAGGAVAATAGPGPKGGPKRVFDAPDEATGFVMCRVPPGAAAAAAQAAAAAGPAAAAMAAVAATGAGPELEAGVAEEEAAALDAATQARLGVLAQVVGRLQRRR
jgi:GNAT superfamily N-acetyltransferase